MAWTQRPAEYELWCTAAKVVVSWRHALSSAMTPYGIAYIGGPADGHVALLETNVPRLWIPRTMKCIRTADGYRKPFIEALFDRELGMRMLDAALYRDDGSLAAQWLIQEEIYGVHLVRPSQSGMHFTCLHQRQSRRISITALANQRLGVFLLREAAIQGGVAQLVGVRVTTFLVRSANYSRRIFRLQHARPRHIACA